MAAMLPEASVPPRDAAAHHAALRRALASVEQSVRSAVFDASACDAARRDVLEVLTHCTSDVRAEDPSIEWQALVVLGDVFAAAGVHGEAHERYAQARTALDGVDAAQRAALHEWYQRALRGEIRSACLLGRGAESVALVERFAAHDAQDADVLALLAATHAARGDSYGQRVATAAMQRLLSRPAASAALLHFVGDAARLLGDAALAILLYRRALAVDPTRPSPRLAIAQLLQSRGDLLAAHLELVAALASTPGWPDGTRALAALHLRAERFEDAIRVLAEHLVRQPADVEGLVLLAEALHACGRDTDARDAVQRARRFDPDHPGALCLDGVLAAAQGRLRDARARWERLFSVAPSSAPAQHAREHAAQLAEELSTSWRDVAAPVVRRS
ncbi:MAG: hypothetical protein MUD17_14250 [Gemmatimonadaceae bacterium]|nr:hypothetical protein [Gemmatimonadaceae bacterium]